MKGVYKEVVDVVFFDKEDVDENFKNIIGFYLLNGYYIVVVIYDE